MLPGVPTSLMRVRGYCFVRAGGDTGTSGGTEVRAFKRVQKPVAGRLRSHDRKQQLTDDDCLRLGNEVSKQSGASANRAGIADEVSAAKETGC
jgi:hypothetical protein